MSTISADELDRMRDEAEKTMPDSAIILRGTFTSNSGGGASGSFIPSGTFPCRYVRMSGREQNLGDRLAADADAVITMRGGVDVDSEDKITVVGEGDFTVQASPGRSYEVTRRLMVKELS